MADVERAVAALEQGGVIVYPTETLYGLGVDATAEAALARLGSLKGRDRGKPVSVLVGSRAMLDDIVDLVTSVAERLIEKFWPGPLTLALPAKPHVSSALTGGAGTIAVRISSEPIAQAIVEGLRRPLTATSANPGGAPAAVDIAAARAYFGRRVDVYVDAGRVLGGPGSTVVDCSTDVPRLVREGAIPLAAIEAVARMRLRRE
ncbi:MAG TPA: L-threonylcarbamoyladenylate synthase [Candidatus Binatia bacterium]|nr:L-threonylcarbamoyladenylate synthase [Candidatus Binatia bacterium]